jgi:tRNA (adenine-N(1)-)-methyltransferase non-catalytic subunit
MANEMEKHTVKVGDYVIIQRQDYTKLHKVGPKCVVTLGRDEIRLESIIGRPVWTTYKMEPKKEGGRRVFTLRECDASESFAEQLKKDLSSGSDNRNIFDDGRSQLLSTEEIIGLRTSGMSGQAIVGQLIENSMTFRDKTEYSQDKYLKKKEKKYFEYVTVRQPTVRLISQIMFRTDPLKILGLRMDTLSQILTTVGIQSQGTYILYESGCQGLVAAAMLNYISVGGHLVHVHPENVPQKQAVFAMNYDSDKMSCLHSVNINGLFEKLLQENPVSNGNSVELPKTENVIDKSFVSESEICDKVIQSEEESPHIIHTNENVIAETGPVIDKSVRDSSKQEDEVIEEKEVVSDVFNEKKRKHSDTEESTLKKPRMELETEKAADILRVSKADGLVVIAREHPANIVTSLLPYVAPSRPFVVYCQFREPLLELYRLLKCRHNTLGNRVTESWLRSNQILASRTHPDISMSGSGGFLLSGIVVEDPANTGGSSTVQE